MLRGAAGQGKPGARRGFRIAPARPICQRAGPMIRAVVRLLPCLSVVCLAACSGTGDEMTAPRANEDVVAGNRIKSGEMFDDDFKKIQNKFGDMNPNMSKDGTYNTGRGRQVSEFNRDNPDFKGRWDGRQYQAGDYKKKSWWGDRDYAKKVYGGDTDANDLKRDSRFGGESAREGSVAAREGGRAFGTEAYTTGQAREASGRRIDRPSDAETDERRRVFTDPDIIPWQQQNGMTIEDSKQRMGR
jgi:hypothetical protein